MNLAGREGGGAAGFGMLITDQRTSLFRSSDPRPHSPADRLASWWCTLFRSFSSVSSVAGRFVLERPIGGPVGLVARSASRETDEPTLRPDAERRDSFLLPSFHLPFLLGLATTPSRRTRCHDAFLRLELTPSNFYHHPNSVSGPYPPLFAPFGQFEVRFAPRYSSNLGMMESSAKRRRGGDN